MNKYRIMLILLMAMICCPTILFAAHPIRGSIDLYSTSTTYPYGTYYGSEISYDIVIWKNVAYVTAHGDNTLFSVDISDPTNPILLDYLKRSKGEGLEIVDDIAYVASWGAGLCVYDVSNPSNINHLWCYRRTNPMDPACWEVDVYRNRAYVSMAQSSCGEDYICGIRILDVFETIPPNPLDTLVSILTTDHRNLRGVEVRGSYAFYTDGLNFEVANVSDENNPYIIKTYYHPDAYMLQGVSLLGDYAYVYGTNGTPGTIVYDISNPANPIEVKRLNEGGNELYFLGNRGFLAGGGANLITLNISNPANPVVSDVTDVWSSGFTDSENAWEESVAGNGRYIYIGTQELYHHPPGPPLYGNNYYRGKLYTAEVFAQDPDDTGPEQWSDISIGEASWDTQYEGNALPTAADLPWQVFEGSQTWAGTLGGVLRVNDTGTASGDKIKWWRNWEATNTHGTTVTVRARCASYVPDGLSDYPYNIYLEDGRRKEEFAILSDKIRTNYSGLEYALDGTEWHTYRITTQGSQFNVYIDEFNFAVLTGSMTAATNRARVMFGSGSSAAMQDIYFDYLHCCSNGVYVPSGINYPTLNINVKVADTAGKGSLSGIDPSSARVYWSTDGGQTWSGSGAAIWDCEYEANAMPSISEPVWTVAEGSETWATVNSGILDINDTSTANGSKVKWSRAWKASPSVGTTVLAHARCISTGGTTTLLGNLYVDNGDRRERFKIMTDRIEAGETGKTYYLDGTQWHIYRITTRNNNFVVYVDEDPTPVLVGTMTASSSQNRVMFGSGASAGTQHILFDYVRYTASGDLLPGQGDGGGPVTVTCTGQNGDYRGLVTAYQVPFNQRSSTLNKIRFSLRDQVGNTGSSPIYNVHIAKPPGPDFDEDGDADQEDFGYLQSCFSGDGVLPEFDCVNADMDGDLDVDVDDVEIFQQCLGGANMPPGC
ncbi:MAG: hypothetical protein JSV03_13020 [Planctomycetota bacterium]|nr:MAG: hypothetical protein JSV03_13020 [Planctomycetota bacterium]